MSVPIAPSRARIRSRSSCGSSSMRRWRASFNSMPSMVPRSLGGSCTLGEMLIPSLADLLAAWRARVVADKAQVEGAREVEDPADFYAPVKDRFRMDPRRTDDATLEVLLALARPDDVWLDVGAGGGRYALPLALAVREVVAIDSSPSMIAALREDAGA